MRLPGGLHSGDLVAVEGGSITALPDGSYAYSADSDTLVLAADAVAVPEFGGAALRVSPLAASAALSLARRLRSGNGMTGIRRRHTYEAASVEGSPRSGRAAPLTVRAAWTA